MRIEQLPLQVELLLTDDGVPRKARWYDWSGDGNELALLKATARRRGFVISWLFDCGNGHFEAILRRITFSQRLCRRVAKARFRQASNRFARLYAGRFANHVAKD